MQEKILSVIVPTYNKENLIGKCLDSFCMEELKEELEVIVIDDGSVDASYEIIAEYAKQYPDIFIPIKKANGGVGSVMNMGLQIAKGKYVKEVDADDWVNSTALLKLVSFLKEADADIVLNPFQMVDSQGQKLQEKYFKGFYYKQKYNIEDVIGKVLFAVQNITVKKELFENNDFVLNTDRYYIDMQLVESSVLFAKTCAILSDSLYRYQVGQEEQSVSLKSYVKNKTSFYNQTILSLKRLEHLAVNGVTSVKYIYQKNAAYYYCIYMYGIYMMDLSSEQTDELKNFDLYLKSFNVNLYKELEKIKFIRHLRSRNWMFLEYQKEHFSKKVQNEIKKRPDAGISVVITL